MSASEVEHSFFPALIDLLIILPGPLTAGWAIPILTDTAFAVALIVLLGDRVPVKFRVFLTAVVIIDDLVAIVVIALFYPAEIDRGYLVPAVAVTGLLAALNRWGVYRNCLAPAHLPVSASRCSCSSRAWHFRT